MTKTRNLVIFLITLFASNVSSVNAQCILNNNNLKRAVDSWSSINTRQDAENTYGGHISQWNTSCCTSFSSLFKFSTRFREDLTKWDTKKVTNMDQLFAVATEFSGNVSTWDVSNVVSMNRIFSRSSNFNAAHVGISRWNTARLKDLRYGFAVSAGFQGDLTGWDTSQVQDFDHMFSESLIFLADLSDWNLPKVTSMDYVFHMSNQFQGRVSGWKLSSALETMRYAFSELKEFTPLDKEGQPTTLDWNTEAVTDLSFGFQGAKDFNSDIVASWTTPSLTTMFSAFSKTKNLHGTVPSSWSTSNVESFASIFATSNNFTSPLVSSFDASSVTDMEMIFKYTKGFAADVSQWTTSKLRTMEQFAYDSDDFQADLSNWDVSKVTSMVEAFFSVGNFPPQMLTNWDTSQLKHSRWIFVDAQWAIAEGEPNPHPICWDLNDVWGDSSLKQATCNSPGIGFDCECINLELAQIINTECKEPVPPPCIGVLPVLVSDVNDSPSPDTAAEESMEEQLSSAPRSSIQILLLLVCSISLLVS